MMMAAIGFLGWAGIVFLALTVFAMLLGAKWLGTAYRSPLGILIDGRGRYSLTHFQIVGWTLLILSGFTACLIVSGDPSNLRIDPKLLALMGIAAGSAVLGSGVKAAKDAPGAKANVARAGMFRRKVLKQTTDADGITSPQVVDEEEEIKPHFSQMWLEEEGNLADQVANITKFQGFIFTLVAMGFFVKLSIDAADLPTLPEPLIWLVGISHAGYIGGKIPNKS